MQILRQTNLEALKLAKELGPEKVFKYFKEKLLLGEEVQVSLLQRNGN
jgi:hypothetical protein